jgi:hypothetical protein
MSNKGGNAMRIRKFASLFVFSLCLVTLLPCAFAGEKGVEPWSGSFEVGFRYVDVDGSNNKYREQIDISKGPRLFNLDLNITPEASLKKYFDFLNVSASNLGGDPFESFGVIIKKYQKFNFRYNRSKATYFYHDTILPESEASTRTENAGDFHTFDYDHVFNKMGFDFLVNNNAKVFFNYDRQAKTGVSTTTQDLVRDMFEFDQPIDQIKDDYTVGAELYFKKFSLYADETYRDYRNNDFYFLPGYSAGEDLTGTGALYDYELDQPYKFKMPQTTIKANFRPDDRLTLNGGFVYAHVDGEYGYFEGTYGIDQNGNVVDTADVGSEDMSRNIYLFSLGGDYDITKKIAFIGGFRYKKLDQDTSGVIADEIVSSEAGIKTWDFDLGLKVTPCEKYSVSGGVQYENRKVNPFTEPEPEETDVTTKRTTFFFTGTAMPSPKLNLFGEYERGDYDDPFTLVSPTDLNRFKFRVRAVVNPTLSVVGTFLRRDIDNNLIDSEYTSNSFSVRGVYKRSRIRGFAGYTWTDIDILSAHDVVAGSSVFFHSSSYKSKLNNFLGGVSVDATNDLTLGFSTNVYDNNDSFALDTQDYEVYGKLRCPMGYTLRVGYLYHKYNEDAFNFDDYNANVVTVSVGYEFGR